MWRKALIVVLLGVIAGWTVLPYFVNRRIERERPLLHQQIAAAFGRPVEFDGVRFSAWSGFALTAQNLRIPDDPYFAATPFIEAKELRLPLGWLALLQGRIEVKRFILIEPEIQIVRNEQGKLNILSRAVAQKDSKAYFFTPPLRIENGTIDFVDRSVKEPIEIRMQNLDLALSDYDRGGARQLSVTANVLPIHGREENLVLEGWVRPSASAPDWTSFPLDLHVRTDGLLITNLVRAVPALRENLADYLGSVGPVRLQARVQGSVHRPQITNLRLAGAFFGAVKTNVRLTGEIRCGDGEACLDPSVKSEIKVDPIDLDRLRKIALFEPVVPQALTAEGPLTLAASLTGNLSRLKVRAEIQAKASAVRYSSWLAKPRGTPASLELAMMIHKDQTRFEDSLLRLHNLKMQFSGLLERAPRKRLILHVRTEGAELGGWDRILPPVARYRLRGNTQFELAVVRSFDAQSPGTTIRGNWSLNEASLLDQKSLRRIEDVNLDFAFKGDEARLADGSFRLGSTPLKLQGVLHNFSAPVFQYVVRAPKLRLLDLDELLARPADHMMAFHGMGEVRLGSETLGGRGAFLPRQECGGRCPIAI